MTERPAPAPAWWLYVLRTADGRLYTGISTDVDRRLTEHAAGRGARSLRAAAPLTPVYRVRVGERGLALQLEYRLKRLPRTAKEALVARQPTLALLRRQLLGATQSGPARALPVP